MANWFTNCITINAATKDELLDYIKASAEEDKLGTVDSVEAYVAALEEGNKKGDDGLWLINPPGMFLEAHFQAETTLSMDVRTPNASSLFEWAERVLAKYSGITITGTALDTTNDNSYELSSISKEDGNGRTINGRYMPKWELEEGWIEIPEGANEYVVPHDIPADCVVRGIQSPMSSLRKIVFHDNIREILDLGGDSNFNEECNVEEVVLGKNAHTTIVEHAFSQLLHLKRIVIPAGTKVECYAFYGCDSLEEVIVEGDVKDLDPYAFCNSNFEQVMAERYPGHFVLRNKWIGGETDTSGEDTGLAF